MPQTRLSVVTESYQKCQNVAGPRSRKNAQNSQVRICGKMLKICRSAVMEKWQKLTGLPSQKIENMLKSAVIQKCQILGSPLLCNDIKNAKNWQVGVHNKMPKSRRSTFTKECQKVAGPRSRKNAKNWHVCGLGKMPKICRFEVTGKYQKCLGQQLCKDA